MIDIVSTLQTNQMPETLMKHKSGSTAETAKAFETMVAGFFVDALMPDDAEGMFAGGTGQSVWTSMLSQQIGSVLAESGVLNLKHNIEMRGTDELNVDHSSMQAG